MRRNRTTITTRVSGEALRKAKALFKEVDSTLAQDGPLDEDEQKRLIQDFEDIQLSNTRSWRVSAVANATSIPAY